MLTKFHYITNLKKWLQVGFWTFYRASESSPFNRSPWPDILVIWAVTHPSNIRSERHLKAVIKWVPVFPTWKDTFLVSKKWVHLVSPQTELLERDTFDNKGLVTRAISCAISCPICCKSQMRFAVSAIWCRILNCYRLHVACDMVLRYGVAICCAICCAIWCAISSCERQTRTRNRTPNRRYT
jgi:hypothetical protein